MTRRSVMMTGLMVTLMVATHHSTCLAAEATAPATDSLVLALDGTDAETDEAGGVRTWRNQAPGGGYDAVQTDPARRPVLDPKNTLNGYPVLHFDGVLGDASDEMLVEGLRLSGETTVFIVARCGSQTTGDSQLRPILTMGFPESTLSVGPTQGGPSTELRYDFAGVSATVGLRLHDGDYRIISAVGGSGYGRMVLYVNGIRKTSGTASQPPQEYGDIVIGGHAGHSSRHFRGDVAEVLVYDAALTDEQRQSVEAYLGDKYELPVGPPPRGPVELYVATDDPNASDRNPGTLEAPLKTLRWAGQVARAGDRVTVRGGTYRETLRAGYSGTANQRIVFQSYKDEKVIVDGSEVVSPDAWTKVEGSQNVYAANLNEALPSGAITHAGSVAFVFADGENLPPCRVEKEGKVVSGIPGDDDVNTWHYNGALRRLTVNLGADRRPAERRVEVTARWAGIDITGQRYITVRGFTVRRANFAGIAARESSDIEIEDCAIEYGHDTGISLAGARNGYVHRNFIRYTGGTSVHANGARDMEIAENVAYAWYTNPHGRMSGYHKVAYTVFGGRYLAHYHNLAIMPPGWTYKGGGFWTDTLGLGHIYIGNATRHTWNSGLYIEAPADNNLIKWNTVTRFRNQGLYLRSNRNNLVAENYVAHGGTALLLRSTTHSENVANNLFSHNWVQNVGTAINVGPQPGGEKMQTLNYFNRNVYDVSSRPFVAYWADNKYESLEAFQEATGQEAYGRVSTFHTDDLGMAYVLVDEPGSRDDPIPMFANPSLDRPMAGDRTRGPFFWRGGDGEGDGDFYTWGRPGAQRYPFKGFHNQRARGNSCGNHWNNVKDIPGTPVGGTVFQAYSLVDIPADERGVGLWSPSLPVAGGAEVDVSFWMQAEDVNPVSDEGGIVVYIEWSDWTGQNRRRGYVIGGENGDIVRPQLHAGTYEWTNVTATVHAPAHARRMALYFGIRSTHGVMSLDGIETLRQRPGRAGAVPETADGEPSIPHVIPVEALTFHTVDLSGVVNRSLRDEEAGDGVGGWTDQGPGYGMEGLPTGRQVQEGVPFELLTPETCVVLRSKRRPAGNLPPSVSIPVEARADVLNFLHTGAWVGDRGTQWVYTVQYTDDSRVNIPVKSGLQVRDWSAAGNSDPFPQQADQRVTVWPEKVGNTLAPECGLYWFQWKNPHPDRAIRAITMETVNEDSVPILLAITRGTKD